jgi:hypothetical protein
LRDREVEKRRAWDVVAQATLASGWQSRRAKRTTGIGKIAGPQCVAINRGEK